MLEVGDAHSYPINLTKIFIYYQKKKKEIPFKVSNISVLFKPKTFISKLLLTKIVMKRLYFVRVFLHYREINIT